MHKKISFLRVFTETGPLVALAVAIALLVGIVQPASEQFFNFPNFGGPPRPPPRSGGYGGSGRRVFRGSTVCRVSPLLPARSHSFFLTSPPLTDPRYSPPALDGVVPAA